MQNTALQEYQTAGTLMLASAALNIVTGAMLFISFVWVCVGVVWLIPILAGFYEAYVGFQMLQGQRQPSARTLSIVGLVCGAMNCNPIPVVLEAVALSKLGKPDVAGYLSDNSL